MYSPGEKIIRFMKGPNFKNMILNIGKGWIWLYNNCMVLYANAEQCSTWCSYFIPFKVIRIILFCMFFTSEFITTPAEPFVANYNEWQTAYAKPIQRDQFCSDFFLIIVCSIGPILTFGLFSLCISGSNKGWYQIQKTSLNRFQFNTI